MRRLQDLDPEGLARRERVWSFAPQGSRESSGGCPQIGYGSVETVVVLVRRFPRPRGCCCEELLSCSGNPVAPLFGRRVGVPGRRSLRLNVFDEGSELGADSYELLEDQDTVAVLLGAPRFGADPFAGLPVTAEHRPASTRPHFTPGRSRSSRARAGSIQLAGPRVLLLRRCR